MEIELTIPVSFIREKNIETKKKKKVYRIMIDHLRTVRILYVHFIRDHVLLSIHSLHTIAALKSTI